MSTIDSRRRSIAKTLTILLSATIVTVSAVTASVIYSIMSQKRYAQLEQKADYFILSLNGSLEIPLWNMDSRNIEKIGDAFTHNELFVSLKVFDNLGNVFYDFTRDHEAAEVSRTREIQHEGQTIGRVEMALTTKLIAEQNRQVLLFGLGVLLMTILAITAATGFFFRRLLSKLFYRMDSIADAYASGTENVSERDMPFVEFQPLIRILSRMGDRLKRQLTEIQEAEKKYRGIFENAVEGIFQTSPDGRYISANPALARMHGYDSPEELIRAISDIGNQLYADPEDRLRLIRRLRNGESVSDFHARCCTKNGDTAWLSIHARPILSDTGEVLYFEGMALNISQQKEAEEAHRKLEQQLLHAQRMESVGRLAGGVAHDFNNMLSVIIGHAELALEELDQNNPLFAEMKEIKNAAERSADITRQLLAFARKQAVMPRVIDLNEIVAGMLKMLQRLIGEEIDISWLPGAEVWPVKMDASQIDQILANLCVNARDAITDQGRITIETGNATFDETYCAHHSEATAGDFVMLAVSDDGQGMDKETLENIFEPFFTTKAIGEGTGLGLATIYGITKQNNGFIYVYSEPGCGTTFKIYLPRHTGEGAQPHIKGHTSKELTRGNETILLVEDDPAILSIANKSLKRLGYNVFAVQTPGEALQEAKKHAGKIHLLMTDVIMPEMNGQELAKELASIFPGLKILFMSGYTADVIAQHGVLDEGINYIQKPFSLQKLAASVRTALDSPN